MDRIMLVGLMIYCTKRRTAADFLDSFVFLMKLSNGTVTVCLFYGEKNKRIRIFVFFLVKNQKKNTFKVVLNVFALQKL